MTQAKNISLRVGHHLVLSFVTLIWSVTVMWKVLRQPKQVQATPRICAFGCRTLTRFPATSSCGRALIGHRSIRTNLSAQVVNNDPVMLKTLSSGHSIIRIPARAYGLLGRITRGTTLILTLSIFLITLNQGGAEQPTMRRYALRMSRTTALYISISQKWDIRTPNVSQQCITPTLSEVALSKSMSQVTH